MIINYRCRKLLLLVFILIKELIKYLNILILPQENGICKLLPIALQLFCIQLVTCHPHRYSTHFEAWKLLQIMPLIDLNCHGIEWRMLWKSSFQFLFSEKGKRFHEFQRQNDSLSKWCNIFLCPKIESKQYPWKNKHFKLCIQIVSMKLWLCVEKTES